MVYYHFVSYPQNTEQAAMSFNNYTNMPLNNMSLVSCYKY